MSKYLISGGAAYATARFVFAAGAGKSLLAAGITVAALYAALKFSP